MRYERPELRPLNARSAAGDAQNCGSGSTATQWNIGCTIGAGVTESGCGAGSGDGWGCYDGAAALFVQAGYCFNGPTAATTCDNGPSPASAVACLGGGNVD